jgi:hypothetical protein
MLLQRLGHLVQEVGLPLLPALGQEVQAVDAPLELLRGVGVRQRTQPSGDFFFGPEPGG